MGFFITNQERLVGDTIKNVLPSCDKLFFLVGYFYFSGFQALYKHITKEQLLKILVGLDAESRIASYIEFSSSNGFPTNEIERRQRWYHSVKKIIANNGEYDTQDSLNAFRLFVDKIKNGTLEVKQTRHPCHAKMYIFQHAPEYNQKGECLGTTIVGSSNLSANGLGQNFEINIQHKDNPFFEESVQIFNELWKEAEILADKNTLSELQAELLDKVWFDRECSPFLLYLKVLIEYFDVKKIEGLKTPSQVLGGEFADLKYQVEAIEQGIRSIQEHSGVIVADVVGLGKSIIATTIAANLNLPVLVIAPPHLIPQWEDYCAHLSIHSKVFSSGKIEDALKYSSKIQRPYLVVLDEAHNYRNPKTQDYSDVETLCRGNKVVILSATPFNNKPEDIFALVRLFQIPAYSTLKSVDNLGEEMRMIEEEYNRINAKSTESTQKYKEIAKKIKWLIHEVVIRRNRKDLESSLYKDDLKKNNIEIPDIADPRLLEYSFGEFSGLYMRTLELLAGKESQFKAARYRAFSYVQDNWKADISNYLSISGDPQKNNTDFLKRLLVRRLESSIFAFNRTLDNIIKSTEKTLQFFQDNQRVLVSKKTRLEDLEDLTLQELDEEWNAEYTTAANSMHSLYATSISHLNEKQEAELVSEGIYLIHKDFLIPDFENDLKNDINLLKKIKDEWKNLTPKNDAKLIYLRKILNKQLQEDPKRKIILFSQFADTIKYLIENLPDDGIIKPISYDASYGKRAKETIRANFDASYPSKDKEDNYNVLFTTDALSEGINLNRAGTVFNYDIPYNPTKVIQRVGRINRINRKVFDKLFIYNFFPTEIGEAETNVKKIASKKMTMIDFILGEDTRYLTPGETLQASLRHLPKNETEEEKSWDTKYREFLENTRRTAPILYEQAKNLPPRVRIARNSTNGDSGVLLFGRRGDVGVFSFCDKNTRQTKYISDEEALGLFEAPKEEKALPVTQEYYSMYQQAQKKLKEELYSQIGAGNKGLLSQAKQAIARLLKNVPEEGKSYLQKVDDILADGLCAAKLQVIKKVEATCKDNIIQAISMLQQAIPLQYVNTVLDIQKRDKEQPITVILSTEFIGPELKGELL